MASPIPFVLPVTIHTLSFILALIILSLSLSLTHTHTHTHTKSMKPKIETSTHNIPLARISLQWQVQCLLYFQLQYTPYLSFFHSSSLSLSLSLSLSSLSHTHTQTQINETRVTVETSTHNIASSNLVVVVWDKNGALCLLLIPFEYIYIYT